MISAGVVGVMGWLLTSLVLKVGTKWGALTSTHILGRFFIYSVGVQGLTLAALEVRTKELELFWQHHDYFESLLTVHEQQLL